MFKIQGDREFSKTIDNIELHMGSGIEELKTPAVDGFSSPEVGGSTKGGKGKGRV